MQAIGPLTTGLASIGSSWVGRFWWWWWWCRCLITEEVNKGGATCQECCPVFLNFWPGRPGFVGPRTELSQPALCLPEGVFDFGNITGGLERANSWISHIWFCLFGFHCCKGSAGTHLSILVSVIEFHLQGGLKPACSTCLYLCKVVSWWSIQASTVLFWGLKKAFMWSLLIELSLSQHHTFAVLFSVYTVLVKFAKCLYGLIYLIKRGPISYQATSLLAFHILASSFILLHL